MNTLQIVGISFVAGVLTGLAIATHTLRSYYAASLKRNIEAAIQQIKLQNLKAEYLKRR